MKKILISFILTLTLFFVLAPYKQAKANYEGTWMCQLVDASGPFGKKVERQITKLSETSYKSVMIGKTQKPMEEVYTLKEGLLLEKNSLKYGMQFKDGKLIGIKVTDGKAVVPALHLVCEKK